MRYADPGPSRIRSLITITITITITDTITVTVTITITWSARFNCSQLLGAVSITRMKKLLGWLVTGMAQITFDYLKIV